MENTLIPPLLLERAAERFRILGEPVRLELLTLLQSRGEMHVGELVEASGQSQANVSKHLGVMARSNILERRRDRQFVYYRINDPSLSGICMLVCAQLQNEAR